MLATGVATRIGEIPANQLGSDWLQDGANAHANCTPLLMQPRRAVLTASWSPASFRPIIEPPVDDHPLPVGHTRHSNGPLPPGTTLGPWRDWASQRTRRRWHV